MRTLATARSLLFVPADRPDRFDKAVAAGADLVCLDLEDAVAPAARGDARVAALRYLAAQRSLQGVGVRINGWQTRDALRDLVALQDADASPAFVMLAKTESAEHIRLLSLQLPGMPLIALIENARGLDAATAIAGAHPQLQAVMLGGADLAAELGCTLAWEPMLHARSMLVAAAAGAGVAAIDVPWLDVGDPAGAEAEAARVAMLGFAAKALIHPLQVAPVHAGLRPTADALARARRVVEAADAAEMAATAHAALLLDGRLVDRPVVLAARRLLARAGD